MTSEATRDASIETASQPSHNTSMSPHTLGRAVQSSSRVLVVSTWPAACTVPCALGGLPGLPCYLRRSEQMLAILRFSTNSLNSEQFPANPYGSPNRSLRCQAPRQAVPRRKSPGAVPVLLYYEWRVFMSCLSVALISRTADCFSLPRDYDVSRSLSPPRQGPPRSGSAVARAKVAAAASPQPRHGKRAH